MFDLRENLEKYAARFPLDAIKVKDFIDLLHRGPKPFDRDNPHGHFTGSAWLLSPDGDSALLTHHRKLNIWVQLGGHCDGDSNVLQVAIREAQEESGIEEVHPISLEIFDIDKHLIPARKNEPEHFHYDIRFLLRAMSRDFKVSDESNELSWFRYDDEKFKDSFDPSVRRMHQKWLQIRAGQLLF